METKDSWADFAAVVLRERIFTEVPPIATAVSPRFSASLHVSAIAFLRVQRQGISQTLGGCELREKVLQDAKSQRMNVHSRSTELRLAHWQAL